MTINLKDTFSINNQMIASQIIDNQAIIILLGKPLKSDCAYTLNNTGTRIWELLDKKKKVENIIKTLCKEFEVDYKKAKREVIKFLTKLLKKEIIYSN